MVGKMTYNFKCNTCNNEFDLDLSYSAYIAALYFRCPYCNDSDVSKIHTSPPEATTKSTIPVKDEQ